MFNSEVQTGQDGYHVIPTVFNRSYKSRLQALALSCQEKCPVPFCPAIPFRPEFPFFAPSPTDSLRLGLTSKVACSGAARRRLRRRSPSLPRPAATLVTCLQCRRTSWTWSSAAAAARTATVARRVSWAPRRRWGCWTCSGTGPRSTLRYKS